MNEPVTESAPELTLEEREARWRAQYAEYLGVERARTSSAAASASASALTIASGDFRLEPNFTFYEFCVTSHTQYLQQNRLEARSYLAEIKEIARFLQRIRDHYGQPVRVHSGFRSQALNRAIKGSKYSQHLKGEAADFHVKGVDLTEVWRWIYQHSGLRFGQLILEGEQPGAPTWIHLSLGPDWRPAARSGQVKTWSRPHGYTDIAQISV